jgi:hypothetical protein
MFPLEADRFRGEIILMARILLIILFVISGWGTHAGAVGYFALQAANALRRSSRKHRSVLQRGGTGCVIGRARERRAGGVASAGASSNRISARFVRSWQSPLSNFSLVR